MTQIQAVISLPRMRRYVKMPRNFDLAPNSTIIDVIFELDKLYYEAIENDGNNHQMDLFNPKFKSALQLLWNPESGQFYEDVGIECRVLSDDSIVIPVEKDWTTPLPNEAWIALTPDAGC